ncbi:Oidioi.mRNA.OKI2018_I69.chr2.g6536.t1.cds [Oikopleura dioica]|uniref:Oidioi.mRNA.OKI2018_I69.chr2.g6536.t1.cds n=1 Tax=Oikopleura dioica TaxID=34765 RepID=A0ABN7TAD7_OIKDI|nr:Oidioi.mRNA.OKI2018_I69.chr2.g6536.t1.cds [Oikopleura dioica]
MLLTKYARQGPKREVTTVKRHQGRSFSFSCLRSDEAIFNGQARLVAEQEDNGNLVYTISAVSKSDEGEYWCSSAPERVFLLKLRRTHRNKQ